MKVIFLSTSIFFMIYLCPLAEGAQLKQEILSVKRDIDKVTQQLNTLREKVARERVPIIKKIRAMEKEVVTLRERARFLRGFSLQKAEGFSRLKEQVEALQEEAKFCSSLLFEYRCDIGKRMGISEEQRFNARLREIDRIINDETIEGTLNAIAPLLRVAEQRNRENTAGFTFEGSCLDMKGVLQEGNFLLFGPSTYFVAEEGNVAGIVDAKLGSMYPYLVADVSASSLRQLSAGREVMIPVDFTRGGAVAVRSLKKPWFQHIKAGGVVMVPILGLGFLCVIIAVWKVISLSGLQTNVGIVLSETINLIHSGSIPAAETKAKSLGRPVGPILFEGVHHHRASREHMEEIMHEKILFQIPYLERGLPVLAVSAAAAPLLGLLGTVTGMIHTFNLVTIFGTGKASLLSGGISEALITTEYGLIIAIPALLVHAYLSRRVKAVIHTLEQVSVSFINEVKIKGKPSP